MLNTSALGKIADILRFELAPTLSYSEKEQVYDIASSIEALIMEELAECIPEDTGPDGQDIAAMLNRFLPGLGAKARGMFVRRYHFHETPREIGDMFGTGEAYVRTVLARARRKLKQFLKEHTEK